MTEDFRRFLAEHGLTNVPEHIRSAYESDADQIGFRCPVRIAIRKSSIEGMGIFATVPFDKGVLIAPLRFGKLRTPAGRYANHSDEPNAEIAKVGQCIYLKAGRRIDADEEITIDYRSALKEGR